MSESPKTARRRQEREARKSSLAELQKIMDLSRVISSSTDLREILRQLLFLLGEILPTRGCAVFVGEDGQAAFGGAPGAAPLIASNFTPGLRQALAHHYEEGIIGWALHERRVCLIPSFEEHPAEGAGDFAIIPLFDNDRNRGFIWIACTIRQEDVDPEMANLLWALSSQASIAIMNCLHRQRLEEQLNELKLLTSINALKGGILRGTRDDGREPGGALRLFYREFRNLIGRELKLGAGYLLFPEGEGGAETAARNPAPEGGDWTAAPPDIDGIPFARHPEMRKLMRLADKECVRVEAGDFFRGAYPRAAAALAAPGLALMSLSPDQPAPAYLLLPLTDDDAARIPALQNLLQAIASQARVVAENIDLYDSLLAANRNLTALQWQLVHSGKMAALGQLAGGVAHEINNPLQILLGRIQMIQLMADGGKGEGDRARLREELDLVTEEVLRIRDIVRNLLDFSRQGKREAVLAPIDLDEIIRDVLALLRHQLISNQVEVRASLSGGPGTCVMGNRNQLKQVFINLMMNAMHAMEKPPRVLEVSTAAEAGAVVAKVRDSGVGIARENLARVFEPFFSTKDMGTGLGLSISYGLIKEHKGSMEVESQEGQGTCFTIRLPPAEAGRDYGLLVG